MSERVGLIRRIVLLIFCIVASGGLSAGITMGVVEVLFKRPATLVKAAFDADTVTYKDGRLQIYFDVDRRSDCRDDTTRWLWTWVTYRNERVRLFMPLAYSPTDVADLGEQRYLLSLAIPDGVWDGTWYYFEKSAVRCGGLLSLVRDEVSEIPPIPIVIRDRAARPEDMWPTEAPAAGSAFIIMGGKPR